MYISPLIAITCPASISLETTTATGARCSFSQCFSITCITSLLCNDVTAMSLIIAAFSPAISPKVFPSNAQ